MTEPGTEAAPPSVEAVSETPTRAPLMAAALLHMTHEEECDRHAIQRAVERVARELHPTRVDILSCDAGPVSTIATVGGGLATHLGPRVLEAGILISEEVDAGGREIGLPIRLGSRLVAALVCRWPTDRQPPPCAVEALELAAAIVAPRVEALLTGLRETSLASTSVPELLGTSAAMADVHRAIAGSATSTAPPSRMISWSQNCSAISEVHLRAPWSIRRGSSRKPTAARSSSTRYRTYRLEGRRSCYVCCSSRKSGASARPSAGRSTSGWWRLPVATCAPRLPRHAFDPIFCIDWMSSGSGSLRCASARRTWRSWRSTSGGRRRRSWSVRRRSATPCSRS